VPPSTKPENVFPVSLFFIIQASGKTASLIFNLFKSLNFMYHQNLYFRRAVGLATCSHVFLTVALCGNKLFNLINLIHS
jgi:hypothetical protein